MRGWGAVRVSEDVANQRRRKIRSYARRKGKTPSKRQVALAEWTILATNAEEEKMNLDAGNIQIEVSLKPLRQSVIMR